LGVQNVESTGDGVHDKMNNMGISSLKNCLLIFGISDGVKVQHVQNSCVFLQSKPIKALNNN
jgi:hypothetical protein